MTTGATQAGRRRGATGRSPGLFGRAAAIAALAWAGSIALATSARATTYVVTTTADGGAGSLRAAIVSANADPGSTIGFSPALAGQTISLASALPAFTATATIDGSGAPGLQVTGNGATTILTGVLFLTNATSFASASAVADGATFNIAGNGATSIAALTGLGSVELGANALAITAAAGTFSGVIDDGGLGGSVTIAGGTQTFAGANTYSGATNIVSGILIAQSTSALSPNSAFTVSSGASLELGGFNNTIVSLAGAGTVNNTAGSAAVLTISGASGVTSFSGTIADGAGGGALGVIKQGAGAQVFAGANIYSGGTEVAGGTLSLAHATAGTIDAAGSGPVIVNGGALELATGGALPNALYLGLGGATATIAATTATTATITSGSLVVYAPVVFGSAADKGTIVFAPTPANVGVGGVYSLEVAGGVLQAGAANSALGSLTGPTSVTTQIDAGGTLDFNGNSATIGNLQGTGGALTNATGAITTIVGGAFGGAIVGAGSVYAGDGVTLGTMLTLSGANTYSGLTYVNSGTLQAGSTGAFSPNSAFSVEAGATLSLNGFSNTIASLADGVGAGVVTNGAASAATLTLGAPTGTTTFSGLIADGGAGALALVVTGPGTQVLAGATNSYSGGTTISGGTLQAASNGAVGGGAVTLNGGVFQAGAANLAIANNFMLANIPGGSAIDNNGNILTLSGTIGGGGPPAPGPAALTFLGLPGGNTILTGDSAYAGGTLICSCATLQLGNGGTSGSITGAVQNGGTLIFDRADAYSFSGVISDELGSHGKVVQAGGGVTTLSGANTYTGVTTISSGALALTGAGGVADSSGVVDNGVFDISATNSGASIRTLSGSGVVTLGGRTLALTNAATTFSGAIGGAGGLTLAGGAQTLAGVNGYSGATTISAGTLALAGGGSIASSSGVVDNGVFDISATTSGASVKTLSGSGAVALGGRTLTLTAASSTFSGAIGGAGGVTIAGGMQTFSGANTYIGATTISGGSLDVAGSLGQTAVTVGTGGTLQGTGSIAGAVTIASGGTLSPGDAPGTITTGSLTLNAGALLSYQLGTPNVVGGPTNDLAIVNGALTIDGGTLNVANSGAFGPGLYQIIDYSGALGGSGRIAVGALPNGATGVIQTAIPGQINLVVSGAGALTQFWDGATTAGDGAIHGGAGTWNNSATNWTTPNGVINASWQRGMAVFAGSAGTATVAEPVSYQGLQFSTTGYVVAATGSGALTPTGAAPVIVDSGVTATIAAPIVGVGGLTKSGPGTLVLSGANTYTGGTTISAGVLQLGAGAASGSIAGNVADNATLLVNRSDAYAFGGAISGSGAVSQAGTGALTLSGINTYSGQTTISAGTLALAGGGGIANSSGVLDNGVFDISATMAGASIKTLSGSGAVALGGQTLTLTAGSSSFAGAIGGAGGLTITGGTQTLAGANAFAGATTISGATLALAGGGSIANSSGVVDNGVFDISGTTSGASAKTLSGSGAVALGGQSLMLTAGSSTFSGAIGGAGGLTIGGGIQTLAGVNGYSGATTISAGTLALAGGGSIANSSGVVDNGVLDISRTNSGAAIQTLSGSGVVTLGAGTLTLTNASSTFSGAINGDGGLTINGGSETLTGDSSFTGGTIISTATLNIGDATHTGKLVGAIANGGRLNFNNASTAGAASITNELGLNFITFNNTSTAGAATITNNWVLAFFDASTAGSATILNASFLEFFGASTAGAATIIQSGGSTNFFGTTGPNGDNRVSVGSIAGAGFVILGANQLTIGGNNLSTAFSGVIDDGGAAGGPGGSLMKIGAGTLTLSGANSYSGGTILAAGALGVGNSSALGTGGVSMIGGTTLQAVANDLALANTFTLVGADAIDTQANAFGLSGAISGTGGLVKLGAGGLTLIAANTYSGGTLLDAGTLAVGNSAALGSGPLTMQDGTTLQFAAPGLSLANAIVLPGVDPTIDTQGNAVTISGVISGAGGLTKIGAGALALTAINTYGGATTIAAGTLVVDGSIASSSSLTLAAGAMLGGAGAVPGFVVPAGASVAPGALTPYSTLRVAGALGFLSGATYFVDVNGAGRSDGIAATGAAALAGGTVNVAAAGGAGYTTTTRYTILTAGGGVSGAFAALTTGANLAFLTPQLSYDANDVYLGFAQTAVFPSVALTRNEQAVAATLQRLGPGAPLFNAVVGQGAASARQAFDALSGEIHASAVSAAFDDARLPREAVLDRLASPYGALPANGGATGFAAMNAIAAPSLPADPFAAWGQAFGSWGHVGGDGNAATLDRSLGGFVLGADATFENRYRLGVAAGYTQSILGDNARAASGHVDSIYGGLYGGASLAALQLRGGAFYAFNRYGANRSVSFPGFSDSASASYGGDALQAFGEAGWRLPLAGLAGPTFFEPFAGALAMHIGTANFTEMAAAGMSGAAVLTSASQGYDYAAATLGMRAEATVFANAPLLARGMIGWRHVFGDVTPSSTLAFASAPSLPFSIAGAPIARDALVVEAGFDWKFTDNATVGVFYSGALGRRDEDNAVKGKLEVAF